MAEIIELKTRKPHPCSDPYCETIVVSEKIYTNIINNYIHEVKMRESQEEYIYALELQISNIKATSLWDRIFNWPYRR